MELLRIAKRRWEVLATSEMLDTLISARVAHQGAIKTMLSLLRETVPLYGPQKDNPQICKYLKSHDLWEFRKQPRGKKLRVVWFADGDRILVCTAAFAKEARTPDLQRSVDLRDQYFAAKERGTLIIHDLER